MKLPEPADIFPLRVWSTLAGYGIAVGSVAITFVITLRLSPLVPPDISSLFLIAVMVSAWRGGLGAGLFATVLSALIDIFISFRQPLHYRLTTETFFNWSSIRSRRSSSGP